MGIDSTRIIACRPLLSYKTVSNDICSKKLSSHAQLFSVDSHQKIIAISRRQADVLLRKSRPRLLFRANTPPKRDSNMVVSATV